MEDLVDLLIEKNSNSVKEETKWDSEYSIDNNIQLDSNDIKTYSYQR